MEENMGQKIATLEVYIDNNPNCDTGLRSPMFGANRPHRLKICTNREGNTGKVERRNMAYVVAHELGHFVANFLHLPAATEREDRMMFDANVAQRDTTPLVPAEQEAWDIADRILPGSSKSEAYDFAMDSYRFHDRIMRERWLPPRGIARAAFRYIPRTRHEYRRAVSDVLALLGTKPNNAMLAAIGLMWSQQIPIKRAVEVLRPAMASEWKAGG